MGEKGPQEGKRKTRKWLQAGNLASGGGGFFDKRKKGRGEKKNQDGSDSDGWLFSLKPVTNKNKTTRL